MNKYKHLSYIFGALAILLSNVMCATVAYEYCTLLWSGRYAGGSAPASIAFLLVIPYLFGMIICAVLARLFWKRQKGAQR